MSTGCHRKQSRGNPYFWSEQLRMMFVGIRQNPARKGMMRKRKLGEEGQELSAKANNPWDDC